MNVSSTSSATAYGLGQLKRQAAQRAAEQLEAKAAALAAQAASARKAADEADRTATSLEVQSGSARTAANGAKLAVVTGDSAVSTGTKIGEQADRILESMRAADDTQKLYGDSSGSSATTGSLIDTTA